jgi:hypothetical protein
MRNLLTAERHTGRAEMTLRLADPPPPWWAADVKPFKPYVYQGLGYDLFEEDDGEDRHDSPALVQDVRAGDALGAVPGGLRPVHGVRGLPSVLGVRVPAGHPLRGGMVTPDLLAGLDHSEVPASCTCTWSWGPPSFRWERTGAKEDCPWHKAGDALMAKVRQP